MKERGWSPRGARRDTKKIAHSERVALKTIQHRKQEIREMRERGEKKSHRQAKRAEWVAREARLGGDTDVCALE